MNFSFHGTSLNPISSAMMNTMFGRGSFCQSCDGFFFASLSLFSLSPLLSDLTDGGAVVGLVPGLVTLVGGAIELLSSCSESPEPLLRELLSSLVGVVSSATLTRAIAHVTAARHRRRSASMVVDRLTFYDYEYEVSGQCSINEDEHESMTMGTILLLDRCIQGRLSKSAVEDYVLFRSSK
eukprot:scpid50057/ scgid8027/ 